MMSQSVIGPLMIDIEYLANCCAWLMTFWRYWGNELKRTLKSLSIKLSGQSAFGENVRKFEAR